MFSNSNAKEHQVNGESTGSPRQINIIGHGTVVEGKIETDQNIRIGGTVRGEVISYGRVIIAEAGRIEGDLIADCADIAGQVQGEVQVEDRLLIRASAVIMGNIQTDQLAVEEGGSFTGRCIMNGSDIETMTGGDEESMLEAEVGSDETEKLHQEQSAAAA